MHLFLFLIFGAFCAGGAVNLLIQRKTINSALSLIVVMGSLALIYMLLGAEFVAVVQVIIYAGAIMVLFIFVIMLLNAGEEETSKGSTVAKIVGIPGLLAGVHHRNLALDSASPGGITPFPLCMAPPIRSA